MSLDDLVTVVGLLRVLAGLAIIGLVAWVVQRRRHRS